MSAVNQHFRSQASDVSSTSKDSFVCIYYKVFLSEEFAGILTVLNAIFTNKTTIQSMSWFGDVVRRYFLRLAMLSQRFTRAKLLVTFECEQFAPFSVFFLACKLSVSVREIPTCCHFVAPELSVLASTSWALPLRNHFVAMATVTILWPLLATP